MEDQAARQKFPRPEFTDATASERSTNSGRACRQSHDSRGSCWGSWGDATPGWPRGSANLTYQSLQVGLCSSRGWALGGGANRNLRPAFGYAWSYPL